MRRLALGLAAVAVAVVPSAGSAVQQSAGSQQVWQVDDSGSHCAVTTGDPSTALLTLRITPGDGWSQLYVVAQKTKLLRKDRDGKVSVTFAPGGDSFQAEAEDWNSHYAGKLVLRMDMAPEFPEALSKGGAMEVSGINAPVWVPVVGAAKAMTWFHQCIEDKLAKWGMDPKSFAGLQAWPGEANNDWINPNDYPGSAIERAKEGDVIARVDVDSSGKATNCTVVSSSGYGPLDNVVCARAMTKAKFTPAIGRDGEPTAAPTTIHIRFWTYNSEYERDYLPHP